MNTTFPQSASPAGARGRPSAQVLAACSAAGVEEVYAIGGAQAIAALAYGTETIDRVDLIAGPGNRYVAEAKRLVSGAVGIDGVAGPSELMVVADGTAVPEWIALDLCAQAEHSADGFLVVASPDAALLDHLEQVVAELADGRPSVQQAPLDYRVPLERRQRIVEPFDLAVRWVPLRWYA